MTCAGRCASSRASPKRWKMSAARTLNEEGADFLTEILKASGPHGRTDRGLLTFSRASRAELSLREPRHHHARRTGALRAAPRDRAHVPSIARCEPGINAWGDVRLMMTVLRNLLGNAWKFTARTPQPAVRFYVEERDGRDLDLRDRRRRRFRHGAGRAAVQAVHAPASAGRICRPWHGTGDRASHRASGTAARSKPRLGRGQGATVRFWLPRRRSENWRTSTGAPRRCSPRRFRFV